MKDDVAGIKADLHHNPSGSEFENIRNRVQNLEKSSVQ